MKALAVKMLICLFIALYQYLFIKLRGEIINSKAIFTNQILSKMASNFSQFLIKFSLAY